jgi:hypothetical protein
MTEAEFQFKLDTFAEFLALGPRVWKNWDFVKDHCVLEMQPPSVKVHAGVLCLGKQRAIGRSILQRSERYSLLLHPMAMDLKPDGLTKILLHELVHLGYSGHGADFRKVCAEVGGVISGSGVTDPGYHVEMKVGARYRKVATFTSEAEAMKWQRNEVLTRRAAGEPNTRWRLAYG